MHAQRDSSSWTYATGFIVGVIGGFVFAGLFAVVAIVLYAITRGEAEPFTEVSLVELVASTVLGFLSAGLLAGALNPLAKNLAGAIFVGTIASIPVALSSIWLLTGSMVPEDADSVFAVVASSITIGTVSAVFFQRELNK